MQDEPLDPDVERALGSLFASLGDLTPSEKAEIRAHYVNKAVRYRADPTLAVSEFVEHETATHERFLADLASYEAKALSAVRDEAEHRRSAATFRELRERSQASFAEHLKRIRESGNRHLGPDAKAV